LFSLHIPLLNFWQNTFSHQPKIQLQMPRSNWSKSWHLGRYERFLPEDNTNAFIDYVMAMKQYVIKY
jgi:hypothetical protein